MEGLVAHVRSTMVIPAGPARHCFYLGQRSDGPKGPGDPITASMATCSGQLSGMLIRGNQTFLLDPHPTGSRQDAAGAVVGMGLASTAHCSMSFLQSDHVDSCRQS